MAEFPAHGGGTGIETDPIAVPKVAEEKARAEGAEGGKQPLDADLTALAALASTSFGRSFIELADAAAARTKLGLGTAATQASGAFDAAGAASAAQAAAIAASQPLDSDLTAIAALTTTVFGQGFLALADAAAARTKLGLGTAALSASSAFDASGAAAAAQAASQPLDTDLSAIAALETTTFGRSLLAQANAAAARETIETNSMAQYERWVMREGMQEKFWPTLNGLRLWKPQASNTTNIANAAHLLRFEPPRNITCRGLSFMVTNLATANDECAIVMKGENSKVTLAESGSVAGKLNSANGRIDIDFTADVLLEFGKAYYPGVQFKTVGGTAATMTTAEIAGSSAGGAIFGNTPPGAYLGAPVTTYPWVGEPAWAQAQNRVYLIVRER